MELSIAKDISNYVLVSVGLGPYQYGIECKYSHLQYCWVVFYDVQDMFYALPWICQDGNFSELA